MSSDSLPNVISPRSLLHNVQDRGVAMSCALARFYQREATILREISDGLSVPGAGFDFGKFKTVVDASPLIDAILQLDQEEADYQFEKARAYPSRTILNPFNERRETELLTQVTRFLEARQVNLVKDRSERRQLRDMLARMPTYLPMLVRSQKVNCEHRISTEYKERREGFKLKVASLHPGCQLVEVGPDGWFRVQTPLQPNSGQSDVQNGKKKKKKRMTVDDANKEAMRLAKLLRAGFFALSERQQAEQIGCSWTTWVKTDFYETAKKSDQPANRSGRHRRKPKVSLPSVSA